MKEYWDNLFFNRTKKFSHDESLPTVCKYLKYNKLLDIGAGDGRNLDYFIENGFRVSCLDYSVIALDKIKNIAETRNVYIPTYLLNIEHDSLENITEKFNSITMIHYFPTIDKIKEILKLLDIDGVLFCCTFINDDLDIDSSKYQIGISREEITLLKKQFNVIYNEEIKDDRGEIYKFIIQNN